MDRTGRSPPSRALSAIALAAGLSRRMADRNKLLLPIEGVPLVRRSVQIIARHPFIEVIVVTGYDSARVEEALAGLPVRTVHNPGYQEGQMTSVRAGLGALRERSEGVMVCLCDQPAVTSDDLATLAQAFVERPNCPVLVPTFQGARGNPIILGTASLQDILARNANFGCKQFVSRNADMVVEFAMPNDHVLVDLDRPEDYAAWVEKAAGDGL